MKVPIDLRKGFVWIVGQASVLHARHLAKGLSGGFWGYHWQAPRSEPMDERIESFLADGSSA